MDFRLGSIPPDAARYPDDARKRAKRAKPKPDESETDGTSADAAEDSYIPSNSSEEETA
jgi:hypothetical protein